MRPLTSSSSETEIAIPSGLDSPRNQIGETRPLRLESRQPSPERFKALTVYSFSSRILALILLVASALKGHELWSGTSKTNSGWVQVGSVSVEATLGVWLLVGLWPKTGWWLALCCFGLFLGVSSGKAIKREANCSCLGRLRTSPLVMSVIDTAAVCILLAFRPYTKGGIFGGRKMLPLSCVIILVVLGITMSVVGENRATGAALEISPSKIRWDKVRKESRQTETFVVTNVSNSAVTVFQVKSSCDCVTPEFPSTIIQPNEQVIGRVSLDLRNKESVQGNLRIEVRGYRQDDTVLFVLPIDVSVESRE